MSALRLLQASVIAALFLHRHPLRTLVVSRPLPWRLSCFVTRR
jgi:hypothetical protein